MNSTPKSNALGGGETSRENEAFITIAANGMKPLKEVLSGDAIVQPSIIGTSPRTHDTKHSIFHMKDIGEFAAKLDQAAKGAFPNCLQSKSRYQEVDVILIQWEDDNRLGVSCELEDLSKVFRLGYGFETTTWFIPTERPLAAIMSKSLTLVNESEKDGKLLIIYYAGHAEMNDSREQVWLRTGRRNEGLLEWFAVQPLFLNARADVLFLLDCCSAASAATSSQTVAGTKETIAACAFETQAPEPGAHSFTCELIEVLHKWKYRAPFSVAMLHSELLVNLRHPKPKRDMFGKIVESRRTPVYFVTTSDSKAISIELASYPEKIQDRQSEGRSRKRRWISPERALTEDELESSTTTPPISKSSVEDPLPMSSESGNYAQDQLNHVLPDGDLAIPHVLISLALEGEQLLEVGAWNKWLSDFPAFAKYARIEGMYKSHSTLLVLSVPVVIWNLVPDHLACSFIGYVHSINHIRDETWQDNEKLQSWLRRRNGWDHERQNIPSEAPDPPENKSKLPQDARDENKNLSTRSRSMSPMATCGTFSLQLNASHSEMSMTRAPLEHEDREPTSLDRIERSLSSPCSAHSYDENYNSDHGSVGSVGSINSVRSIVYWGGVSPPLSEVNSEPKPDSLELRPFGSYASPSPPGTLPIGTSDADTQSVFYPSNGLLWRARSAETDPETAAPQSNSGEQQEGGPRGNQTSKDHVSKTQLPEEPVSESPVSEIDRLLKAICAEWKPEQEEVKDSLSALQASVEAKSNPQSTVENLGFISPFYMYSPLNDARKEIRLAVLLPGKANDSVRVSLRLVSLQESPQYEALSYCWGNCAEQSSIYVDNRNFVVTLSLWDALRSLRSEKSPRIMWIDSICINQQDFRERGNQVMMMRNIYQQAEQVVVWLGSETKSTGDFLEFLNRNEADILQESELLTYKSQEIFRNIWAALSSDLLARPYWRRLWIHQEIALACHIGVVCGGSCVDWNLLTATAKFVIRYLASFESLNQITAKVTEVETSRLLQLLELDQLRIRRHASVAEAASIQELAVRFQKFQTTDPRDKIFALFGLSDHEKYLVPDYQKTASQVYFEFARNIIMKDHSLDIITLCNESTIPNENRLDLPSWVPDWSVDRAYHSLNLGIQLGNHFSKPFRALGLYTGLILFSGNYRTLVAKGILFDRIQTVVSSPSDLKGRFFSYMTAAMKTASLSGDPLYVTGEDIQTSVSRTLSADLDWRQGRCRPGETFWDIFKHTYLTTREDYEPEAPGGKKLEMLRRDMLNHVIRMNVGRSFMMTDHKYMGLVPASAKPGDLVCILFGCAVPIILRQQYGNHTLVGECYIHGIMDGETMVGVERNIETQTFSIV